MRIPGSKIALALLMAATSFGQAPLPPLPSELPVLAPVTNAPARRVFPVARPGRGIPAQQTPVSISSNGLPNIAAAQRYQPAYVPDDVLKWDATEKEIHAKEGELELDFSFAVTNVSRGDVTINWVRPSCGCTVAKLPPTPWTLKPGDGGTIDFKFDLRGKFGVLSKYVSIDTSHGQKLLMIKAHIPPQTVAQPGMDSRAKNMQLAMADRQVVFRGDCAKCHAEPAAGKMGEQLYTAACAICHDAPHRATMVPDLRAVGKATGPDYWSFWIANGKPGTLMPGFAKAHGGPLDEAQIRSLAEFLYEKFPRAEAATAASTATPPPPPIPAGKPSGAGN
jgi:mono/diheme cytochrome c family protein